MIHQLEHEDAVGLVVYLHGLSDLSPRAGVVKTHLALRNAQSIVRNDTVNVRLWTCEVQTEHGGANYQRFVCLGYHGTNGLSSL